METKKEGLGKAYHQHLFTIEHIQPFVIIQMDADFLTIQMTYLCSKEIAKGADMVVGARYIKEVLSQKTGEFTEKYCLFC